MRRNATRFNARPLASEPSRNRVEVYFGWVAPKVLLWREMDEAFRRRAEARRATWTGGVARSFEELESKGFEFWNAASPSQKLNAMWQLLVDGWVIEGKHGPPPGLQGSVVGIGRLER